MAINPIDELNIVPAESESGTVRRAIPFREFFRPMGISKAQKERRVKAAERISDVFAVALSMLNPENPYGVAALGTALFYLQQELMRAYGELVDHYDDEWFAQHAQNLINDVLGANGRHPDDPYYVSDDRADVIAENDANSIIGYDELQDAIAAGMTVKTWHGMLDKKERKTHVAMEGTTIPITELFDVNGSLMQVPGDDSEGADPAEIVNCRCWVTFS